jgi:pimeloyl-ACP methyl ester carboxylesterase
MLLPNNTSSESSLPTTRSGRSGRSARSGWRRPQPGLVVALAATLALALGVGGRASADDDDRDLDGDHRNTADHARARDVLLVHGAWADGSSWADVIVRLQRDGYTVRAVQLPLQSLAGDAAVVRAEIDRIGRPVVVAGHSYGGAVIGEAAAGAPNVVGLVYAAAYALDNGESLGALNARFAATPILQALVFDAQGNATVDPEAFTQLFAPDVPARQARVLATVQKPISGAIFGTPAGHPAWREVPSWYQVSRDDQVIAPELQRFVAARMGARVVELSSSHASLVSHPRAIAELIEQASRGR